MTVKELKEIIKDTPDHYVLTIAFEGLNVSDVHVHEGVETVDFEY